ncbi:MAG: hypothetical protein HRU41_27910 [Saprospiraceae bacterium]|nr:hypothetical protein [Saprospiraceae bacterium]
MKNLKTILTLVSLLVIGFTAGFFTNRELVKRHIQKVGEMGGGPRLHDYIYTAIEATDDQKAVLGPIIKEHGRELSKLMRETRTNRKEIMDKMFAAVGEEISAEQQEQLTAFRKKYLKRKRPDRGRKGGFQKKRERGPKKELKKENVGEN